MWLNDSATSALAAEIEKWQARASCRSGRLAIEALNPKDEDDMKSLKYLPFVLRHLRSRICGDGRLSACRNIDDLRRRGRHQLHF